MNLFTPAQREQLLNNGANPDRNHQPVVRLFLSNTSCTWLINELYADEPDLAFGLCDLGFAFPELGYCYLPEVQDAENPDAGIILQIDEAFKGNYGMSVYADAAHVSRRIVTDDVTLTRFVPKPTR